MWTSQISVSYSKASLRSSSLTLTAEIKLRYPGPQGIGRQKLVCLPNVRKLEYLSEEDEIEEFNNAIAEIILARASQMGTWNLRQVENRKN